MDTIYKAFLVILGSKGGLQAAVNQDDSTVTGEHTIRIEKSYTNKAIREATNRGHTRIAKDLQAAVDLVGDEFYRVKVDEDTYTTDVPTKVEGKRITWGMEFYELASSPENRGRDFVKEAESKETPQPKQAEEAGPVTRIPANADAVTTATKALTESFQKGDIDAEAFAKAIAALQS